MPLVNPSNLYHGAAVTLNTQPSTNMAIQLMAKEQAKKDALNQYYAKQQQSLLDTEKKMRPQDIVDPNNPNQGWLNDFNDMQSHYLQNRDAILRPRNANDYAAKAAYESKYNDLMSKASQSINENEMSKQLFMAAKNPNFHMTDNDMNILHANNKSIYDPSGQIPITDPQTGIAVNRRPTVDDLSANIAPFDAKKQMDFEKMVTGNIGMDETPNLNTIQKDPTTGKLLVTTHTGYSPEKLKAIADNVPKKFDPYTSAYVNYDNELNALHQPGHENDLANVNKAYQSVYGATDANGNPNVINSPETLAQADIIMKKQQAGQDKAKFVTDLPAQWQHQINMLYTRAGLSRKNSEAEYDYREGGGKAGLSGSNDLLGQNADKYSFTEDNPTVDPSKPFNSTTTTAKYVDANKIDPTQMSVITNKGDVVPLETPSGKKAFRVESNGNWTGKSIYTGEEQNIDRQTVAQMWNKTKGRANAGIDNSVPQTGTNTPVKTNNPQPQTKTVTITKKTSKGLPILQ